MQRKTIFELVVLILIALMVIGNTILTGNDNITFSKTDRIVVFAAHEDDEAIGATTIMSRAIANGADVSVVILTDGAPQEFGQDNFMSVMSEIRKNETKSAMSLIGVKKENIIFLDYDDLGFIFEINVTHEIERITSILKEKNPTYVFVHAYEGGHIDHDATNYLVVQAIKKSEIPIHAYEFPEYNKYYWGASIPDKLDTIDNTKYPTIVLDLNNKEVELKKKVLQQYNSQRPSTLSGGVSSGMPRDNASMKYVIYYSEFEMYKITHPTSIETSPHQQISNNSVSAGARATSASPLTGCNENYLVCVYYWPDVVRKLPIYDYEKRPHPPNIEYEDFFKKIGINKSFGDFKHAITK